MVKGVCRPEGIRLVGPVVDDGVGRGSGDVGHDQPTAVVRQGVESVDTRIGRLYEPGVFNGKFCR